MYCNQCGALVDGQDLFCKNCGHNRTISSHQSVNVYEPEKELILDAFIKKQEAQKGSFFRNYGKILLIAPVTEIVIRLFVSIYLASLLMPQFGVLPVMEKMLPGCMMVPLRWLLIWSIPLIIVMRRKTPFKKTWSIVIGILWMSFLAGAFSIMYRSLGVRSEYVDAATVFWLVPISVYILLRAHARNCVNAMPRGLAE